ncbi:MAG: hypothetical protein WA964_13175 [Ilumatobacter sp.]|uniref:hypothetical protein n=1 Tax=Ilumatobacter sp. TaxID=1967498 RepID=UPI003C788AB4
MVTELTLRPVGTGRYPTSTVSNIAATIGTPLPDVPLRAVPSNDTVSTGRRTAQAGLDLVRLLV